MRHPYVGNRGMKWIPAVSFRIGFGVLPRIRYAVEALAHPHVLSAYLTHELAMKLVASARLRIGRNFRVAAVKVRFHFVAERELRVTVF
ncbi:hypothetical protein D3C81_1303240 [compost metagenome]